MQVTAKCSLRVAMALAILAVLALIAPANAAIIGAELTLQVSAGGVTEDVEVQLVELPPQASDRAKYVMQKVLQVRGEGGGQLLGTIDDLSVEFIADPVITLGFSMQAGALDTTFSIQSATLTFPALDNPTGEFVVELTLEDLGGAQGASVEKVGTNAGMFKATYNGTSLFAELLDEASFTTGGPIDADGSVGPGVVPGSVTSMQSGIEMVLSAGDKVSGTSVFTIVPEPATIALLGLGSLALIRRR